jgi:hypothetical protein
MKALFFGVGTLCLIVGNDAQAACNDVCQSKCRAFHEYNGLTYEQCVAKWSKLWENPAEARRILNRRGCGSGFAVAGRCYYWGGR